ncbi:MAG TPA: glycosyltransferase [Aggregatilineaceae bacterium]|nr:glycosyltransferase [Aggregatilineaceae bacterium]
MHAPRPIRVMRIIARLNTGGPAIHVTLLTERLGPPDFENMLVCGHIGPQEGDMAYLAEERGLRPVYMTELGRELSPARDTLTLFKLWRLMLEFRPDVVDTHTAKAGFLGRTAAWLARVPVRIHTFHGHVFRGYFGPRKTRMFLELERFTARLSDRLITLSPGLKTELVETYRIAPADRFEVIPLGLDLVPFAETRRRRGEFRAQFNIPPDVSLVGIVGRIVPVKDHMLFLDMADRLRKTIPNAHFAIVGDGECRRAVEDRATALGLRGSVTFSGFLRDLRPVYSDLDVLVLSSRNEGTPVSVIEALAAGVPVVSTAVGGVPDLLRGGDYGHLVPSGDPDALVAAVATALTEPSSQRESIRQAITADHDISRLVEQMARLYRGLLASKRGNDGL